MKDSGLYDRVVDGDVPLYAVEDEAESADEAVEVRRKVIEEETGASLANVGEYVFDAETATDKNVENMVGGIQIPLGVAGPLRVDGEYASGEYYVPMATTEGALVASTNRGASAATESGGVSSRLFKDSMTRAPVFRVEGVEHAKEVVDWLSESFETVKTAAEETTSHGELVAADPYVAGDSLYLRLSYDTKDAMGMNMATVASRAVSEVVEEETGASLIALSGNMCTDKKPAAINQIEGRGRTVSADVEMERSTVENVLNTTPENVAEVNSRKTLVGSARAGSFGFNAHVSNVLSAVYIATGQDPAQVVEGSMATTTASVKDGDLYFSVTLPAVEVGTVGGGTSLETQNEALSILGVEGGGDPPGGNARAFAEIIGGAAVAGELSLHAALASRHLSESHEKLGR
ncbi:MAG: hydroxymethylglutaryl-CoA reductase (NADPH) [Halobacteria archaeon]|nr:hydroxymethylglutaryl-CoA reductase (NADPH) [Halobacteria archaeon]